MVLPSIAQHARSHDIKPLKSYGQNFLFDGSLCDKIVRHSGVDDKSNIIEIGPGVAGLTRSLLSINPKSLTAIEADIRCINLLNEVQMQHPQLTVIHGDALEFNISEYVNDRKICSVDIVANLPYNIGTVLLVSWLKQLEYINSITIMLQKEVVDRICATKDNKNYGRLSVIVQLTCMVAKCFDVEAQAFYPPPKVCSSIVRLLPKKIRPSKVVIEQVENVTMDAFGHRRKMLRSSMKNLSPRIIEIMNSLSIADTKRAENLSPEQYLSIAQQLVSL